MKLRAFFVLCAALLVSILPIGSAHAQQTAKPAPSVETNQPAKPATRKISKKRVSETVKAAEAPALMDRLEDHRLAVRRGEQREQTSAYLIEEIIVTGTYKSVEGYGAFLRASNGRTFFAHTGMKFYDGSVLQIEPDQVIFQQVLADGKKKQIVKIYDPNALRISSINSKADSEEKDKGKKEKKEKKKTPPKEETEEKDASEEED
jgi:hypothetical protein